MHNPMIRSLMLFNGGLTNNLFALCPLRYFIHYKAGRDVMSYTQLRTAFFEIIKLA
jgi:hypothetical protein